MDGIDLKPVVEQSTEIKITDGERSWTFEKGSVTDVYLNGHGKSIILYCESGTLIQMPLNANTVRQCVEHDII